MLSISNPLKGGDCGNYYFRISSEEYYASQGCEKGKWQGGAVSTLIPSRILSAEMFRSLLNGFDTKGKILVQNAGHKDRWRGWDLTLSAPKSVSVLWALAPKNARKLIRKAHEEAVITALRWVEEHHCITRRGKGGKIREHGKVLFASFFHYESRSQDPQLHTHSVLLNLALRADGSTGALHSIDFFRAKKEAGNVYQAVLKQKLFEFLRLTCVEEKNGFRIVGIPEHICEHFSKRRAEIVQKMAQAKLSGAVASKEITLKTRSRKVHVKKAALFHKWRIEAEKLGWASKYAAILIEAAAVQRRWEKGNDVTESENVHSKRETPLMKAKKRAAEILAKNPSAQQDEKRSVKTDETNSSRSIWRELPQSKDFSHESNTLHHPSTPQDEKRSVTTDEANSGKSIWRELPQSKDPPRDSNTSYHQSDKTKPNAKDRKSLFEELKKKKRKKWGKVVWRNDWFVNELRIQERYLFPSLPKWCPLSELTEYRFRVVTAPSAKKKKVLLEATLGPIHAKIVATPAFKRAPFWSPAKCISIPHLNISVAQGKAPEEEGKSHRERHSH